MPGTLYLVANHLGNPDDLTPRAVATLRNADVVFAEDTRSARAQLGALGIERPLVSCFDGNEGDRADELRERLGRNETVVLFSEAGTPAISDPGYKMVALAVEVGARVTIAPGAAAAIAALAISGLPTDKFYFGGFPARKPGARRDQFAALRSLEATLIFYESPHRTGETLADLALAFGDKRRAAVCRELSKTHEEVIRGDLASLAARYETDRPLGEITLIVEGANNEATADEATDDETLRKRARELLAQGLSTKDAAQILATERGRTRREVYPLVAQESAAMKLPKEPS